MGNTAFFFYRSVEIGWEKGALWIMFPNAVYLCVCVCLYCGCRHALMSQLEGYVRWLLNSDNCSLARSVFKYIDIDVGNRQLFSSLWKQREQNTLRKWIGGGQEESDTIYVPPLLLPWAPVAVPEACIAATQKRLGLFIYLFNLRKHSVNTCCGSNFSSGQKINNSSPHAPTIPFWMRRIIGYIQTLG